MRQMWCSLAFGVLEEISVDFTQRDGQRLFLQTGLDQRSDVFEDAVTELVVVVVDLARALGRVDDQGVLGRGAFEQLVDRRVGDAERGCRRQAERPDLLRTRLKCCSLLCLLN